MRKFYIILAILGGVVLILLAVAAILLGLAMDSTSAAAKPPKVDFVSMISGMRKLNRQMAKMTKSPRGAERQMTLTEAEFNAVAASFFGNTFAASLLGGAGNAPLPRELLNTRLQVKDGTFLLTYVHDTGRKTPFGRYVNIYCRFDARVEKGKLRLKILSCDAGSFPVPDGLAQYYLNQFLKQKYTGSNVEKIISDSVIRFQAEDGNLNLRYHPQEMVDTADQVFFGTPDNKVRRFLNRYGK